jgi:hypothetical protein
MNFNAAAGFGAKTGGAALGTGTGVFAMSAKPAAIATQAGGAAPPAAGGAFTAATVTAAKSGGFGGTGMSTGSFASQPRGASAQAAPLAGVNSGTSPAKGGTTSVSAPRAPEPAAAPGRAGSSTRDAASAERAPSGTGSKAPAGAARGMKVPAIAPSRRKDTFIDTVRLATVCIGGNAFVSLPFATTAEVNRPSAVEDMEVVARLGLNHRTQYLAAQVASLSSERGDHEVIYMARPVAVPPPPSAAAVRATAGNALGLVTTAVEGPPVFAVVSPHGHRHSFVDMRRSRVWDFVTTCTVVTACLHPESPGHILCFLSNGTIELFFVDVDAEESPDVVRCVRTWTPSARRSPRNDSPKTTPKATPKSAPQSPSTKTHSKHFDAKPPSFVGMAFIDPTISTPPTIAFVDAAGSVYVAPLEADSLPVKTTGVITTGPLDVNLLITGDHATASAVAFTAACVDRRAGTFAVVVATDAAKLEVYHVNETVLTAALSPAGIPPQKDPKQLEASATKPPLSGNGGKERVGQGAKSAEASTPVAVAKPRKHAQAYHTATVDVSPCDQRRYAVRLTRGRENSENFVIVSVAPLEALPAKDGEKSATNVAPASTTTTKQHAAAPDERFPCESKRLQFAVCLPVWSPDAGVWAYGVGPSFDHFAPAGTDATPPAPLAVPVPSARAGLAFAGAAKYDDKTVPSLDVQRAEALGLTSCDPVLGSDCLAYVEAHAAPQGNNSLGTVHTNRMFLPLRLLMHSALLATTAATTDTIEFVEAPKIVPPATLRQLTTAVGKVSLTALQHAHYDRLVVPGPNEKVTSKAPEDTRTLIKDAERLLDAAIKAFSPKDAEFRRRRDETARRLTELARRFELQYTAMGKAVVEAETARMHSHGAEAIYELNGRMGAVLVQLAECEAYVSRDSSPVARPKSLDEAQGGVSESPEVRKPVS